LRNKAYNEIVESSLHNTSLTDEVIKALSLNHDMDSIASPEAERIRNLLFPPETEKIRDLLTSHEVKKAQDILSTSLPSNLEPDYLAELSKFQSQSLKKEELKKLFELVDSLKDDKDH